MNEQTKDLITSISAIVSSVAVIVGIYVASLAISTQQEQFRYQVRPSLQPSDWSLNHISENGDIRATISFGKLTNVGNGAAINTLTFTEMHDSEPASSTSPRYAVLSSPVGRIERINPGETIHIDYKVPIHWPRMKDEDSCNNVEIRIPIDTSLHYS